MVNPTLTGVSVNPTSVTGGVTSTGTVTLNGPAPSGGEAISLSSSDPSTTVPASVTIPAGQTSAPFTATTSAVSNQTTVTITATDPDNNQQAATLTVNPSPPADLRELTLGASMSFGPEVISGNRVYVHGTAPAGEVVTLTSSDPSAVRVPASVTVQPGASSRTFNISVVKNDPAETVTITAGYNGQTQSAQITVAPAPTSLKSVVANPTSLEGSATSETSRVYLTANATSTTVVSLASSDPAVASVPKSVTVQQGYSSHVFTIATQPVTSTQQVTITATAGGVTQVTTLTVTP